MHSVNFLNLKTITEIKIIVKMWIKLCTRDYENTSFLKFLNLS